MDVKVCDAHPAAAMVVVGGGPGAGAVRAWCPSGAAAETISGCVGSGGAGGSGGRQSQVFEGGGVDGAEEA